MAGRRIPDSVRGDLGLVTLEWLLVVAAIAGLAATTVLAVQRVVDTASDRPPSPEVRAIDAEIAAAFVAHEATQCEEDPGCTYISLPFLSRCQDVADNYSDVVQFTPTSWVDPVPVPGSPTVTPAECNLTRL